ncbi:MAG: hypothetical protein M3Y82_07225, partial [Verrucomicrobiota bacterium]|nr:hypothetical protein [Verrucomicrobiota bacterium]
PAFAILLFSMLSVESFFWQSGRERSHPFILNWICDFIVVTMVGLYFSLRIKSFMAAWLLTCLATLFLPSCLAGLGMAGLYRIGMGSAESWKTLMTSQTLLLVLFGIMAASRLHSELKNRSFVLGRW